MAMNGLRVDDYIDWHQSESAEKNLEKIPDC